MNNTLANSWDQDRGISEARSSGIAGLAGTWTEADHQEFLGSMDVLEEIDPELWK